MAFARVSALIAAVLWLHAGQGAFAHDTHASGEGGEAVGAELGVAVEVSPGAAVPPVVTVPLGARVRLSVTGAGEAELHLHGYDVEARGGDGPAVLVFEAAHEGRFPVEAHVEDDLLGQRGRPVLFVEVRGP